MSQSSNEAGVTSHVLAVADHGVPEIHVLTFFPFKSKQGVIPQGWILLFRDGMFHVLEPCSG